MNWLLMFQLLESTPRPTDTEEKVVRKRVKQRRATLAKKAKAVREKRRKTKAETSSSCEDSDGDDSNSEETPEKRPRIDLPPPEVMVQ